MDLIINIIIILVSVILAGIVGGQVKKRLEKAHKIKKMRNNGKSCKTPSKPKNA